MFIRKLTDESRSILAQEAAEVLARGGVVLFPTDTLYCLGADALSDGAVDTIYAIKGREPHKPMHALVPDVEMAAAYGEVSSASRALLERAPAGKLSLVVPRREAHQSGILRGIDTFGFRIPQHPFCEELLAAFGKPITATSANAAGQEPSQNLGAVLGQLGPAVSLIDLAIDGGELPASRPSTVVDMSGGTPVILREGAIPAAFFETHDA